MQYIVHKRFKTKAICGDVNLPAMTICECIDGFICYNNIPICASTSENAHQFFAINDDGNGILRGKLTQAIIKKLTVKLSIDDEVYQSRWDKVWADEKCRPYKRIEYDDHWLWNHDFYNAPIEDLQYIAKLVGASFK